ncbi:MAG: ABC transporter ATP-binding protein [Spirochaetales bacterium]|nr:ABC transporter ATP-binding protein [Spirochaetales bacterium]
MRRFVKFFTYLKPFIKKIILLFCFICITTLITLPVPMLEKTIIDEAIPEKNIHYLFLLIGVIAALYAVNQTIGYLRNITSISVREKVLCRVRIDLYHHLQKMSMKFFSGRQSGSLLSRMLSDVGYIQNLVNDEFFVIISSFFRVGVVVYLLLTISWKISLLCLTVLPVVLTVFLLLRKKIYIFTKRLQEALAQLSGKVQENISSIKIIQAETAEENKGRETALHCENLANLTIRQSRVAIIGNYIITLFTYVPLLVIIWSIGGADVIKETLSLGSLLAYIQYLFGVIGPVTNFLRFNMNLQAGYAALDRVYEILDEPPEIIDRPDAVPVSTPLQSIVFSDVSLHFSDPEHPDKIIEALSHISLTIKRGEKIGIVGPSGGGKTSLVNLLLRFYHPTEGVIRLNDREIDAYTINSVRRTIAYMPQEEFLFNDTVRNNITLGREYPDEAIEKALEVASAFEFVRSLREGLDTVIGERGVTLSGGQRQRLALSRIFLKQPDMFVFDEAFSALDSESETLIFNALPRIIGDRTAIIIAHRFSFLNLVERILVFANGKCVEDGSFDELVNKDGLFSKLYTIGKLERPT